MIKPGASLFFRDPKIAAERVLVPARLIEKIDESLVADLHPTERFEAGQAVTIFFELQREFMQQPVQIDSLQAGEEGPRVRFFPIGDPVSAESRQHFRVAAITTELVARIGQEEGCEVQDVSATGFSAIASTEYALGICLPVSIHYGGGSCEGDAVVQSICERRQGYRYGFFSADGARLRDQLNQLSLAVQREQLRRLSGAAGA